MNASQTKPNLYLFEHRPTGVFYYGYGHAPKDALRDLLDILKHRPSEKAPAEVKARYAALINYGVIDPTKRFSFQPALWQVSTLAKNITLVLYHSLLAEFVRVNTNDRLLNLKTNIFYKAALTKLRRTATVKQSLVVYAAGLDLPISLGHSDTGTLEPSQYPPSKRILA